MSTRAGECDCARPAGFDTRYWDERLRPFAWLRYAFDAKSLGQAIEEIVVEREGRDTWMALGASELRRRLTQVGEQMFRLQRRVNVGMMSTIRTESCERLLEEGDELWERWQALLSSTRCRSPEDCPGGEFRGGDGRSPRQRKADLVEVGACAVESLLGKGGAFGDSSAPLVWAWMQDALLWNTNSDRELQFCT